MGSFTIVEFRINETRQTGAVGNRTYRVDLHSVRLETEPTGGQKRIHSKFYIHRNSIPNTSNRVTVFNHSNWR